MSWLANADKYKKLVGDFVNAKISGEEFSDQFMDLWKADRDEEYSIEKTWPRRYDLDLSKQLEAGEITKEQYSQGYDNLYSRTFETNNLNRLLDSLFTGCNCYYPGIPKEQLSAVEYNDEEQLRNFVRPYYEKLISDEWRSPDFSDEGLPNY